MHGGDATLLRTIVAGQRRRLPQPRQRTPVAAAQKLDVAEFAAGRRGERRRAITAHADGLVQRGGAFFVAAARRMHERAAQGDARARAQLRIAGGVGLHDRAPQALQPGLERAGADRGLAGVELRNGGGAAGGRPGDRCGGRRAYRGFERRARLHAELALEQFAACGGLARCADAVTRGGEAAHEQRLEVLVQRVLAHEPGRQVGGFDHRTGRQTGQCGLAQNRLGGRLKVSTLGGKPDFEGWAARKAHPFEQFAAEAVHTQGLRPGAHGHDLDIDIGRRRFHRQHRHFAAQSRDAEQAPELAEVPAQCGQRVLGVFE